MNVGAEKKYLVYSKILIGNKGDIIEKAKNYLT